MNIHMVWPYSYTPSIWPSFFTVVFLLILAVYSGRRRSVPGALPFSIGCLFAALWAAGSVMEVAAVDIQTKIFWVKFQGVWHLPVATAITCFVLEYAWPGRWLTRRNLALLSIPCLLLLGMILTDDFHHLIWRGFVFDGTVIPLRGPGNWTIFAYGYGLGIVNLIVLAWLFLHSPQHRWPVVVMVTGLVGGRGLYLLEASQGLSYSLPYNLPPIAFEYLMYAIALFGFRIFDPIPLARQAVIAQMHEGVLVLDPQGRIVSLNPAAERILDGFAGHFRGQPVRELLPAYPDGHLDNTKETEVELSLGAGPAVRHYTLEISDLKDWRGLEVGRLLLLHDITDLKRTQKRLIQDQSALATLHERERVARELHDDLSQQLAFINLQAQAAHELLAAGQAGQADTYLKQMAEVARESYADVRELISGLMLTTTPEGGMLGSLCRFIEEFDRKYGIHAELILSDGVPAVSLDPTVEVQLLRIVQEAFTNIRKHACAQHVQVRLANNPDGLEVIIEDDGAGFDPEGLNGTGKNFGLKIMQERAAEIGGALQIFSTPGRGTRISVKVPGSIPQEVRP